jgi:hypothetical protein
VAYRKHFYMKALIAPALLKLMRVAVNLVFPVCASIRAAAAEASGDIAIELRIVENVTKNPISGALVSLSISDSHFESLGGSTNGNFAFSRPATTKSIRLRLDGDAYADQDVSLALTNSVIKREIKLDRVIPFFGIAIAPNGQYASRAQVVLISDQNVNLRPDATVLSFSDFVYRLRTKMACSAFCHTRQLIRF